MSRLKYISLSEFKESVDDIIKEVYTEDVEYVIMIANQPKARIAPIDNNGKNVVLEEDVEESKLKEFVS